MPGLPARAVGVVWYRREDYGRILAIMADADKLPATWDKWFYSADKLVRHLTKQGAIVEKVQIDPETFPAWCAARGLNLDAEARNRFSAEAVGRQHGATH